MKQLTPEEHLDRLEWRREIRNVMGRISHDYAVKQGAADYVPHRGRRGKQRRMPFENVTKRHHDRPVKLSIHGPKGGRSGGWLWERYDSEFVYRDGRRWWFHEQVCPDIEDSYDKTNWAQDRFLKYLNGKLHIVDCSAPPVSGVSDLRQAHNDISVVQPVHDTVPASEPYEKLDEAHTYSPAAPSLRAFPSIPRARASAIRCIERAVKMH